MGARALSILCCVGCFACGADHTADVTTVDDGGVQRTVSRAPLWSDGEGWQIREIMRIGSVSGEEGDWFAGSLLSVNIGPHGNIFVLDEQADRVNVYRPNGDFLRFIGRARAGARRAFQPHGIRVGQARPSLDHQRLPTPVHRLRLPGELREEGAATDGRSIAASAPPSLHGGRSPSRPGRIHE